MKALRVQADEQLAMTLQEKELGEEEEGGGEERGKEEEERRILAMVRKFRSEGFPTSRTTTMKKTRSSGGSSLQGNLGKKELKKKKKKKKEKRARSSWSDEEEDEEEDEEDSDDIGLFGPRRGGREGEREGEEEEEEEEWAMEGPTTRSGTTIVYRPTLSPSTSQDTGLLSSEGGGGREGGKEGWRALPVLKPLESEREMEARKKKRLELLVERTTAIRTRLEKGIASLLSVGGGAAGGGGGEGRREGGRRCRRWCWRAGGF